MATINMDWDSVFISQYFGLFILLCSVLINYPHMYPIPNRVNYNMVWLESWNRITYNNIHSETQNLYAISCSKIKF